MSHRIVAFAFSKQFAAAASAAGLFPKTNLVPVFLKYLPYCQFYTLEF